MTRLWTGWPRNQVSNPGRDKAVSPRACRQALWSNELPNQWVLKRPSPKGKADRTWSWLLISLPCGSKKCARYTSNPPYMPSCSNINRLPQALWHTWSPRSYTTPQFVVGFFQTVFHSFDRRQYSGSLLWYLSSHNSTLTMGWAVLGSNPSKDKRFSPLLNHPAHLLHPPNLQFNGQ